MIQGDNATAYGKDRVVVVLVAAPGDIFETKPPRAGIPVFKNGVGDAIFVTLTRAGKKIPNATIADIVELENQLRSCWEFTNIDLSSYIPAIKKVFVIIGEV